MPQHIIAPLCPLDTKIFTPRTRVVARLEVQVPQEQWQNKQQSCECCILRQRDGFSENTISVARLGLKETASETLLRYS